MRSWLIVSAVVVPTLLGCRFTGVSASPSARRPTPVPDAPPTRSSTSTPPRADPARQAADDNWVVVAPSKRHLMFEDGTPFVPMGIATSGDLINLDYFGATTVRGRTYRFSTDHFESLFADMRAHGENHLRIDIEGTGHLPRQETVRLIEQGKLQFLESPTGEFNEDYARRLDRLIAAAEKHDIYLGLVLIAHTCDLTRAKTGHFDLYPYHASQGGPLRTMDDLFTSREARDRWLRRMKYVSDRWGRSRRIAYWELYNELLNCGGTDAEAAQRWVAEMGQALRQHELSRYGKAHPVAVSTVSFVPKHRFFLDSPGTDLVVTHFYTAEGESGNPIVVAKAIRDGVLENLEAIDFSRPFLENERTLSRRYPDEVQRKLEHAAAWSLIASGAASPGATWVVLGEGMAFRDKAVVSDTHKAMRAILDTIDFSTFDSRPARVTSSNPEVLPMVLSGGSSVLGWVLHDNPDDYDIEHINAWRARKKATDKVLAAQAIGNWVRIVDEHGDSSRLDAHFDRIARVISQRTGLSHAEALERAKAALRSPQKAAPFLRKFAAEKGWETVREKVVENITGFVAALEETERRRGILERTYRGHPKVTSDLTVEGLGAGAHRVVWYDDETGATIRVDSVSGSRVVLKTPPFSEHIAFTLMAGPRGGKRAAP